MAHAPPLCFFILLIVPAQLFNTQKRIHIFAQRIFCLKMPPPPRGMRQLLNCLTLLLPHGCVILQRWGEGVWEVIQKV